MLLSNLAQHTPEQSSVKTARYSQHQTVLANLLELLIHLAAFRLREADRATIKLCLPAPMHLGMLLCMQPAAIARSATVSCRLTMRSILLIVAAERGRNHWDQHDDLTVF